MSTELFKINLGRRIENVNGEKRELWHVTSPDAIKGRINYEDWHKFLSNLKKNFKKHRIDWGMYGKPDGTTQPVYEYNCDLDDLKYVISDFILQNFNGKVLYNIFDYSREENFSDMYPEIKDTQIALDFPFY